MTAKDNLNNTTHKGQFQRKGVDIDTNTMNCNTESSKQLSSWKMKLLNTEHSTPTIMILATSMILMIFINYCIKADQVEHVTCGSLIKLKSDARGDVRLHTHDIKYGSGSGQQSVTGAESKESSSYWFVKGELNKNCERGEPIKCGSIIRLQHEHTRKYLHSHLFKSPLSNQQEVSAFGNDEDSDTGDHWMVNCDRKYWIQGESIRLQHVDTGKWLTLSSNTYGRPIHGQKEIVGAANPSSLSYWKTLEGVHVQPLSKFYNEGVNHEEL